MIVPKPEFEEIMRGEVGEVVTPLERTVGESCYVRDSPRRQPVLTEVVDVWAVPDGFAVLLRRIRPARRPPERPRLRLTRAQRVKLFAGEAPHIGGEGQPPVEAGETVRLSSKVTLAVLRVDVKYGKWKLHYELKDARDPVRLLRRTPPAHREGDEEQHPTPSALRDAAEQSHYTSTPSAAVPGDPGEAPPRVWLEVRAKAIGEFHHQKRLARHAEKMRAKSKANRKRAA